jgi:hypothetical protein
MKHSEIRPLDPVQFRIFGMAARKHFKFPDNTPTEGNVKAECKHCNSFISLKNDTFEHGQYRMTSVKCIVHLKLK